MISSHYLKLLGEKHIYYNDHYYVIGPENEIRKRKTNYPMPERNENKDCHKCHGEGKLA